MKNTLFLIVGQNFDYDFKIVSGETNISEILNYVFSNDLKQEHGFEIRQSEAGKYRAGWGRIVYKIDNKGILLYYNSNVDSSG